MIADAVFVGMVACCCVCLMLLHVLQLSYTRKHTRTSSFSIIQDYWAYMAKKGFVSLIPKFASMQMEVGFTIEAHTDSEMPECMLGSTVLSYITDTTGPMISPEMQEPVHEHQALCWR